MIQVIKAESLKYKRTFARRLILFSPLFIIIIALLQKLLIPPVYLKPWELHLVQVYNWWPVLFVPLGTALFASLVELQEKRAGNYRNLRVHPVSPLAIWIGKIALMAYHTLLATIILILAVILSGLITAGGEIPWATILAGGLSVWLTSLAVIPIQLWAASWKGTFFGMAVGLIGMISGIVSAPTPCWIYVPWSWQIRLMCPIVGVHPNGVPLEADNPLRDPSVIPIGFVLAVIAFLIFTTVTAVWFKRRDVK